MINRPRRALLISALVAVASMTVAQPVLADVELGHRGTVGAHSLDDTSSNPGATGKYRYYASDNHGWLTRLWVDPPNMKAVAGKSSQTVSWLFKVQRKDCGFGGCSRWKVTYTSPEQTAVTSDAHNASFTQATVRVNVPCGHNCADLGSNYRVVIKMIWHGNGGGVQGSANHRIYWYGAQMTNGESGVQEGYAGAAWSPDF